MTTTVVNCGIGNVGAIPSMLARIGESCIVTDCPDAIRSGSKIILPGVGSFNTAMRRLRETGLDDLIDQKAREEKVPVLGICLGMQLMGEGSQEGDQRGFGWIRGRCVQLGVGAMDRSLRVPQMGWNEIVVRRRAALFDGLDNGARFYFAHSYHLVCDDPDDVVTVTVYGHPFASAVQRENVMGVQFHPEKSHRFGLKLLENFVRM